MDGKAALKAEALILYVADIQASRRFYEGVLGFKPRLDAGDYCELDLGGIALGLMPRAALPHFLGEPGRRQWTDTAPRCELYLLVEKPAEVVGRLEKAGARRLAPLAMRPWGDVAAYFEDPDGHVLAVARRTDRFYELNYPAKAAPAPEPDMKAERLSVFFEQDHAVIGALLDGVPFGSPLEAVSSFKRFDRRLERHIHWEEGVLFPSASRKAPELEEGPLRTMKLEHEQLRRLKAAALNALREGDGGQARAHAEALAVSLRDHNASEERSLYPACDNLLSREETRELFERIRTLTAPSAG